MDTVLDDNFDVRSWLDEPASSSLNQINNAVDPNEMDSELKMTAFLQQIGADSPDTTDAYKTGAAVVYGQTTSQGTWEAVKEGWKNNDYQMQIADIRYAEMYNRISPQEAERQVALIRANIKDTYTQGFASWAKSGAGIVPMMLETTKAGLQMGLLGAGTGATVATIAGQAGPQALIPEEAATIPGSAIAGFKLGMPLGAAKRAMELEAGLMYDELLQMTDANGNKIDPAIAKPIAQTVGAINGLLELVQIKTLIKTIPGGKKLFSRASKKTTASLLRSRTFLNVVTRGMARYGGAVATETGTELIQESTNIIGAELAKNLSNELNQTEMTPAQKEEILDRFMGTAIESIKGFSLLALPGNLVQTAMDLGGQTVTAAPKDAAQPVERIYKTQSGEKIVPRVDIDQLGKTKIEEPAELPPKKPRKKPAKEAVEKTPTPEEEYLSQQSEATLAATEPFTIKAKLYIGNVTQRMKKAVTEGMEASWEQVRGFMEGAFPTKRTEIELTMGEARRLLLHMETSLQERLDKNQILNEVDLAHANADWGDIRELRKQLGLPQVPRPYSVTRNPGSGFITIDNVQKRIRGATQPSSLFSVQTTQLGRLNDVMAKVQKEAAAAFKAGKKEAKEYFALLQYLREQRRIRDRLIAQIKDKPGTDVDFYYREAIQGLQEQIDFGAKTEQQGEKKNTLRELINKNPELENEIPAKIRDDLSKKDIESLSMTDLETLNNEIQRLRNLGALKSSLFQKQRKAALKAKTEAMTKDAQKAKKNILPSMERAHTLRPNRIFDMLDGGKNFLGKIYDFFYQTTNDNYNAELQNTDARQESARKRREALNISVRDLSRKRTIGKLTLALDEWLSVYAGWKNPASRAALKYGGIPQKVGGKEVFTEVTDAMYAEIEAALSEAEKAWADTIIEEYAEHYPRMRRAVIEAENRDPGHQVNYTKMRRRGIQFKTTEEEVIDELNARKFFYQVGPNKAFTLDRQNIPPEFQKPIELGLTKIHLEEIRKQEHYINNARHLKDMRFAANDPQFRQTIEERFGAPVLKTVDEFIDRVANPDFYKSFNEIESLSKVLRRNVALAYISFNVSSVLNQFPSVLNYWSYSSASDMLSGALNLLFHPRKAYESAVNAHYQLSHQSIEREMEELRRADANAYQKIVGAIGRTGMLGIYIIDRATRIVGINAIYNKAIRDGMSPAEASRKAATVTLRVQEAASPKDLARLYASNEVLNWFTMFTNQLNQIYNMTTYDIPVAFYNGNYNEAVRSSVALGLAAMLIWMIDRGELSDEPEDAAVALAEQTVGSVPLIGSAIVSGARGWQSQAPPPIMAGAKLGKAGAYLADEDLEKALSQLAEPVAITTGFPYQAAKEAIQFIEEAD